MRKIVVALGLSVALISCKKKQAAPANGDIGAATSAAGSSGAAARSDGAAGNATAGSAAPGSAAPGSAAPDHVATTNLGSATAVLAPATVPIKSGGVGTLKHLQNGDRGCYVTIENTHGTTSSAGDFELCKGGQHDATQLIGKRVAIKMQARSVQAAACAGDPACTKTDTVNLIIGLNAVPNLPKAAEIKHGQQYWAVYVALGPVTSPTMLDSIDGALALGYELRAKDPTCDVGAVDALRPNDPKAENRLLSVYFDTQADALKVAAAFKPGDPWVGKVTTMCLD